MNMIITTILMANEQNSLLMETQKKTNLKREPKFRLALNKLTVKLVDQPILNNDGSLLSSLRCLYITVLFECCIRIALY